MIRCSILSLAVALLLAGAGPALAHPVSFKGGTGVMVFAGRQSQDLEIFHSFAADQAVGPRLLRIDGDKDGQKVRRRVAGAQYNRLIKRWWWEDAQANIYLGAGLGRADGRDVTGDPVGIGLFQADYETRRVYVGAKADLFQSADFTHVSWTADLGAAPWAANYDEPAPWLLLRLHQTTELDERPDLVPTFRLIWGPSLLEAGWGLTMGPRLTAMFHF